MTKKEIDLICLHGTNGEVTPIRLRLKDEDGQYQAYTIKEYRDLTKIKDSAELDITITKKLSHTKNFNTPIWQSTVKQAVNNFPESKTLVKFYRTYKVTVK